MLVPEEELQKVAGIGPAAVKKQAAAGYMTIEAQQEPALKNLKR